MFSRTSKTDTRSIPSIVSADAAVTGDIRSDGDIQIEGRVTGDVACKRMTLGAAATVEGRIECDTVHVHGAVNGEIDAETVVVSATAKIAGDIHHESISVETGVRIEGRLVRREPKAARLNLVTDQSAAAD